MIIIDVEVLMNDGEDIGSRSPNPAGINLWNLFKEATSGYVVLLVPEGMRGTLLSTWLVKAGFSNINVNYHYASDPMEKAKIIHQMMSAYGSIDWYVDVDPDTIAATMSYGIKSLLMAAPYVLDRPVDSLSFQEMVDEINRQKMLRSDVRLED